MNAQNDGFLFFWGHTEAAGKVTKACLSQWYPCRFVVDGHEYANAEQFMMAEKARIMGDEHVRREILATCDPMGVKKLGRKVANFDQQVWDNAKYGVVVAANCAKFSQNADLREFLLSTGDRILVEASPYDVIWGIGLDASHPDAANPAKWRGLNLLGLALMQARSILRTETEYASPGVDWDDRAFLRKLEAARSNGDYGLVKALRVEEYKNTIDIVMQGFYINSLGEKVSLRYPDVGKAKFFSCEIINDPKKTLRFPATDVEVVNDDCLAVAMRIKGEGFNPAVLNMASRRNPGGGVAAGSGAQEETLFRRTDLFLSMYQFAGYADKFGIVKSPCQYPLDRNFGGVYTPAAMIFRQDEAHGYRLMDAPVEMAFISVAGMNGPELADLQTIAPHLVPGVKNKMRTILRIGAMHGHDCLVLGALGCGAFRNPPRHVARLFHEVLLEPEFRHAFAKIVFAVLDDHNAHQAHNPEGNYAPFAREFKDGRL